ncbi:MAG: uroporphyrinogen decarboxylase [Pseudomonadales bacterium]|nr:uroporphyrinogen decarboxylase [Pseudomonadales bacterium]
MTSVRESVYSSASRGEKTPYTPIWLNRQAGRYMPEYHRVKADTVSLDFFKHPDLAAKVTLDAQRILGVDAAIMFADLLPILEPMGMRLEYKLGEGPVFENPLRSSEDVEALRVIPAQEGAGYVGQIITNILQELPKDIALLGFAGAPFTLASYAIEGRGSRNYVNVKQMMHRAPETWDLLMSKLVLVIEDYVKLQIKSGVDAVKIFDSWVGCLSISDYQNFVAPYTKRLMSAITGQVPITYFGVENMHLLDMMYQTGADSLALDWKTPLRSTWDRIGCRSIEGNFDPILLCTDKNTIAREARRILDEVDGKPGHIFNLGHGIIPETPVDNVKFLVDYVHEYSAGK